MRYGRFGLGLLVVIAALWVIVGEQITSVSSDAVVNARLTTLRTPIAGTVDMPLSPFGTKFEGGEVIATVTDPLVDVIRLNDLGLERSVLAAQIIQTNRDIQDTENQISRLSARAEAYRIFHREEIDVKLERARERVKLLNSIETEASATNSENGETVIVAAATAELSLARQEVETLQIAQDGAARGVNLGDAYNDATATEIKLADLSSSSSRLKSALSSIQMQSTHLETRIAQERRRTDLLGAATLTAPTDGVLWEVLASDGENVQRGQDIMRLMNCGSALVTLSVPDVVYNKLRVGQQAKFRLNSSDALFDGTITRIAGAGAETIYQNLAIAPSIKHLERYDVALLVPALRDNTKLRCAVGQTGRVFFDERPLDWLRGLLR